MLETTNEIANVEAEESVLGSILMEASLINEAFLKPSEFYADRNQLIYKAMKDLKAEDEPIDIVTIYSKLDDVAKERIGGITYLAQLADTVPTVTRFKSHQQLVRKAFKVRKSLQLCSAFEHTPSLDTLRQLTKNLNELIEEESITNTSNKDVLLEIYNEIISPVSGLKGIDTGFKDLNTMLDGLQNGNLIILAARPSVGKTALALNFAINASKKNTKVIYFTFEMSRKELLHRSLSSVTRIDSMILRKGLKYMTDNEYRHAVDSFGIIDEWDLIIDEHSQSVFDISLFVRSQLKDNIDKDCLVIIDYLQLMKTDRSIERHDLRIGEITRELKLLAKELDIPIVLLSQLNRNTANRADKRPLMSDLRDSGNIEQDADVILLLHRDDYYNRESDLQNIMEVNIAKHRNGPVGAVNLLFMKESGTFLDLAHHTQ